MGTPAAQIPIAIEDRFFQDDENLFGKHPLTTSTVEVNEVMMAKSEPASSSTAKKVYSYSGKKSTAFNDLVDERNDAMAAAQMRRESEALESDVLEKGQRRGEKHKTSTTSIKVNEVMVANSEAASSLSSEDRKRREMFVQMDRAFRTPLALDDPNLPQDHIETVDSATFHAATDEQSRDPLIHKIAPSDPRPLLPGPNRDGISVETAVEKLPDCELEEIKRLLSAEEFATKTPEEWKTHIVMNRITSAICHYCRAKGTTPLFYCGACHCTFFCSAWCQKQDVQHLLWCCIPNAVMDTGPTQVVIERDMKKAALNDEQKEQVKKMGEMARERQLLSNRWAITENQCIGDVLLGQSKFEAALAFYTAAVRKPNLSKDDVNIKLGSFYGRAKCFYGMELYHLAIAEMYVMERVFKMVISPECVHIRIRCMVKLCMFKEALADFKNIIAAPCFNNIEFRIVQKLAENPPTAEQKAKIGAYNPCQRPLFKLFTPDDPAKHEKYIELVNKALMGEAQKEPFAVVKESPVHGLGMFSGCDLKEGEWVFGDAADVVGSVATGFCETCTKPFNKKKKRVNCNGNCGAMFCSAECNELAMKDFHTWQCDKEIQKSISQYKAVQQEGGQTVTSRMPMLMMRLLGKCSRRENALESMIFLREIKFGAQRGMVSLEQGLAEYSKIMIALRLQAEWFDYFTFDYLRMSLLNNTFSMEMEGQGKLPFALTLYQSLSFVNHSCAPNCFIAFDVKNHGNRIFLIAKGSIKKGEEVTISYIPEGADFKMRKKFLDSRYGFECTCPLCKKDLLQMKLESLTPAQRGKLLGKGLDVMRATKAGEASESIAEFTQELLEERKNKPE